MVFKTFAIGLAAVLLAASACSAPAPPASGNTGSGASPSASAKLDRKAVCDTVTRARKTALDALTHVSSNLDGKNVAALEMAKATDDVKAALTALHVEVATAAQNADDPQLAPTIVAYQISVEQAIVAAEGADGDQAKLRAAMKLPAMQSAEQAMTAACAG